MQWELKGIGPGLRDVSWSLTWGSGGANGTACTTIPGDVVSFPANPSVYGTSSTYEGDGSQAWTVSFNDGFVRYEPKGAAKLVRAVRGES